MTVKRGNRVAIIWIVLAALIVVVVGLEFKDRTAQSGAEVATGPQMLLPAPLEEIGAIEIAVDGNLHRFSRDKDSAWFYHGVHAGPQNVHEHITDPEMSEKIAASLGGLGRARIERRFELTEDDAFGVTKPDMIVLVFLPDQVEPRMQYSIGDLAPDDLSRYIHIVGGPQVITIPDYQIKNLRALLATVTAETLPQSALENQDKP